MCLDEKEQVLAQSHHEWSHSALEDLFFVFQLYGDFVLECIIDPCCFHVNAEYEILD
jgi:hypothetical protein